MQWVQLSSFGVCLGAALMFGSEVTGQPAAPLVPGSLSNPGFHSGDLDPAETKARENTQQSGFEDDMYRAYTGLRADWELAADCTLEKPIRA